MKPLNILLADDDMDDCNFFKNALAALHIKTQLTTVNDGEQLMNYLSEQDADLPDVLFLDLNMPRKNGFECLTAMKEHVVLRNLPVVVLSTLSAKDKIDKIFKIGGHVYVHKPSDFGQLKQVIQNALPIALDHIFSKSPLKYILNA